MVLFGRQCGPICLQTKYVYELMLLIALLLLLEYFEERFMMYSEDCFGL